MAISVDWPAKIIFVPKADLTLVQSSPTEIREMDINWFRLQLKDLEDDIEGMVCPDTHRHNPPVTVGGVELARVVEIINDYTVTFEDGQYAVNLVGANSNIADRTNVNQVSIRSANSAGLVSSRDIEFISFENRVTVDPNSATVGTIYPTGTRRKPVNNIPDAIIIAEYYGFSEIYVLGDLTFGAESVLSGYIIRGESVLRSNFNILPAATVEGCEIRDAHVTGTLDADALVENCNIGPLVYVRGMIQNCGLVLGDVILGGDQVALVNCWSEGHDDEMPEIDMNGSGTSLLVRDHSGGLKIKNKTGEDYVSLAFTSGSLVLDETVTGGTFRIRGDVSLEDHSTGTTIDIQESGGISPADQLRLLEIYRILGLDNTRPLVSSPTVMSAGSEIVQDISDEDNVVTVTRRP